jgi:hypothetical protein
VQSLSQVTGLASGGRGFDVLSLVGETALAQLVSARTGTVGDSW